jgi:hypothetical protein
MAATGGAAAGTTSSVAHDDEPGNIPQAASSSWSGSGGAHPISTVLFVQDDDDRGSCRDAIEDLASFCLVQAGKVPPIPIETRPADQASAPLSDLKSGGKVQGRVVLLH